MVDLLQRARRGAGTTDAVGRRVVHARRPARRARRRRPAAIAASSTQIEAHVGDAVQAGLAQAAGQRARGPRASLGQRDEIGERPGRHRDAVGALDAPPRPWRWPPRPSAGAPIRRISRAVARPAVAAAARRRDARRRARRSRRRRCGAGARPTASMPSCTRSVVVDERAMSVRAVERPCPPASLPAMRVERRCGHRGRRRHAGLRP